MSCGYHSEPPALTVPFCFGVVQAVSDSGRIMAELARVIRPGGEVWVDALNAANLAVCWDRLRRRLKRKPMHLRYESPSTLLDYDAPYRLRKIVPALADHLAATILPAVPRRGAFHNPLGAPNDARSGPDQPFSGYPRRTHREGRSDMQQLTFCDSPVGDRCVSQFRKAQ